jgi:GTPase SAR1 family protein
VLYQTVSLIQGPPGTGKTTLATSIIYNMFHKVKTLILVCALSYNAVNNFTKQLMDTGLNLFKVVSYTGYGRLSNLIKRVTLLQKVFNNPAVDSSFVYQDNLLLHTNHHLEKLKMTGYNEQLNNYQSDVLSEAELCFPLAQ